MKAAMGRESWRTLGSGMSCVGAPQAGSGGRADRSVDPFATGARSQLGYSRGTHGNPLVRKRLSSVYHQACATIAQH